MDATPDRDIVETLTEIERLKNEPSALEASAHVLAELVYQVLCWVDASFSVIELDVARKVFEFLASLDAVG